MTFSSNLRTWKDGFQLGFGDHALLGGCGKREQRHESSGSIADKASTQSLEEGAWSARLLQTEFRRPRHCWLELRPPRHDLTGKPHFRFAPDCFGQMRPKRRHGRFGAMRVAPAVGPFSIKIVRMVGDTAHLAASPSLTLSAVPEGQQYQCGRRVKRAIQFCGVRRRCDRSACGGLNAPRDVTAFRQRRPYARRARREKQPQ